MSRTLSQLVVGSPSLLYLLHPDTVNYRNTILAKGARISPKDTLSIDRFVNSIYANNLRPLMLECYPFAGDNLGAALVKLWHVSTPNLTNVGFTDANYTPATSITGNGVAYLNSNFIPSNSLTVSNCSLGVYNRTSNFENHIIVGCSNNNDSQFNMLVGWSDGNNYFDAYNVSTGRLAVANPGLRPQGFHIGSRVSLLDSRYFLNGTQLGMQITGGGTIPTIPQYWFSYNNVGVAATFSTKSAGFGFVGRGMTPAQVSTLTTIVNQLMTDLGRAV